LAFFAVVAVLLAFSQANAAQENAAGDSPWETFGVNLGVFVSATDTSFRIGSGIGLSIDAEQALNLDATTTVFRADALWRFTDNKRHRLELTWFSLKRDATRVIGQDITFEDKDGNPITIDAGTTVESNFDFDIYELAYSYSFSRMTASTWLRESAFHHALGLRFKVLWRHRRGRVGEFYCPLACVRTAHGCRPDPQMVPANRIAGLLSAIRQFHRIGIRIQGGGRVQPLEACGPGAGI
jgi:hypothetical protein